MHLDWKGGGMYGDKSATLERIKQSILNLPQNIRNRLVLENDEASNNTISSISY